MHISDVVLLLLATAVIAQLFWEFQPQSDNAAGSVVLPETTALSLTMVLMHKYVMYIYTYIDWFQELNHPVCVNPTLSLTC